MEKRLKIATSELRTGMCVVDLDRPWLETPFLFQGFIISGDSDIQTVQKYCRHVYIDTTRGARPEPRQSQTAASNREPERSRLFGLLTRRSPERVTTPVEKEIHQASAVHQKTSALVRNFMDDIRLGRALNVQAIEGSVSEMVDSILRNPDAMSWLTQLRRKDADQEQHSINVCILALTFGRHLGLPRDEMQKLGISALLHDIGKLQVPEDLLKKVAPLTDDEWQIMRKHTEYGRSLLMSARDLYFGAVDVAQTHHERIDGKGYPRGLSGAQISPFAKIVAIVDTYDDIVSPHPYREERTAFEAMKEINGGRGSQFDESLVKHFIEMVGVFPVGSIVELSSGEVGVVIANNNRHSMQPRIMLLLDTGKRECRERLLNLAAVHDAPRIVRILRRGDYGIDPLQLQQRALGSRTALATPGTTAA